MQWAESVIRDIDEKLAQLGLKACPVCDSETALRVDRRPIILSVGGVAWSDESGVHDNETNIDYLLRVECSLCGYSLLFNSQRFITGDTPALIPGRPRRTQAS
jgi:hypothetical protein